jgi:hypothetical protein
VLVWLSGAAGVAGGGGAAVPWLVCMWHSRLVLMAIELVWLLWFISKSRNPGGRLGFLKIGKDLDLEFVAAS